MKIMSASNIEGSSNSDSGNKFVVALWLEAQNSASSAGCNTDPVFIWNYQRNWAIG